MIAFISYSIKNTEFPVVTILSEYLKDRFSVETLNADEHGGQLERQSPFFGASLFVGITTTSGKKKESVKKLFKLARERNIPSMLFEEVTSKTNSSVSQENVIKFHKSNPDTILERIRLKTEEVIKAVSEQKEASFIDSQELAWLVSGSTAANIVNWLSRVK